MCRDGAVVSGCCVVWCCQGTVDDGRGGGKVGGSVDVTVESGWERWMREVGG